MSHALIQKAREQRRNALLQVRRKSLVTRMEDDGDMKNIFDVSDWTRAGDNVVAFRNLRLPPEMLTQLVGRLH